MTTADPTFVVTEDGDVHWFTRSKEAEGFWRTAGSDAELVEDGSDHPLTRKVLDARIRDYTLHNRNGVFVMRDGEIVEERENTWEPIASSS